MRLRNFRALTYVLAVGLVLNGCGVNKIPTLDEQVKAAWSEVLNQYQRRADSDSEPRRDGQGLCSPGAAGPDPSDRGARESDLDAVAGGHPVESASVPSVRAESGSGRRGRSGVCWR